MDYSELVEFFQDYYKTTDFIPLHAPTIKGNEQKYVADAIASTFVSSVGEYVDRFERSLESSTGAQYAVATVTGTAAVHTGLLVAGVLPNDEVLTQSLTFVATSNAISYCQSHPVFIDIDRDTLSMSPESLAEYLDLNTEQTDHGFCLNKKSGRIIRACMPMHTFGHPGRIQEIAKICQSRGIALIEDAAESLGSYYKGTHTGLYGLCGAVSFNGNKIVTTGGGGALLTNDEVVAQKARHLTTTAKVSHKWEYRHDLIGYNFRMPNLNAAFGCGQLEQLSNFLDNKRTLSEAISNWCAGRQDISFVSEPANARSNYWLNTVLVGSEGERDLLLQHTNSKGVMTRPCWIPMHQLDMFKHCQRDNLVNTEIIAGRAVNLPSSTTL